MRKSMKRLFLLLLGYCWMLGTCEADALKWNNTSTEAGNLWSNVDNWSPTKAPAAGDTVTISNGGTVDWGSSGGNFYGDVTLSDGSIVANDTGTNTYNMNNGFTMTGGTVDLNVQRFLLGIMGTTESTISGGTFTYRDDVATANGSMRVGVSWLGITPSGNAEATLNIINDAEFNAARMVVGYSDGGYNASGTVVIGDKAKVVIGNDAGGELSFIFGSSGSGKVTVKDWADVTVGGTISLGVRDGTGEFTLQDNGVLNGNILQVQNGLYQQTGGTATFSGNLTVSKGGKMKITGGNIRGKNIYLGTEAGSTGVLVMEKGTLESGNDIYVGRLGNGAWDMKGGDITTNYLVVGYRATSSGVFNVSGGKVTVKNNFRVGYEGLGTGKVSGGEFIVANLFICGNSESEEESSLTIVGNESTWNVGTFTMVNNFSTLNFVFDKGGFSTIATRGAVTLASGATISVGMGEIQGMEAVKSNEFQLVTGNFTNNGVQLEDSRHWTVSIQDNGRVVATLQDYFTELPEVSVTEGVFQMPESSNSLSFYSNILDEETMDAFTGWLVESSDDVTSATGDALGNVLVQFAEAINYFAFNFDAFNLQHADNPAGFSAPIQVPEPATWGMLLLGILGLWKFRGSGKKIDLYR